MCLLKPERLDRRLLFLGCIFCPQRLLGYRLSMARESVLSSRCLKAFDLKSLEE